MFHVIDIKLFIGITCIYEKENRPKSQSDFLAINIYLHCVSCVRCMNFSIEKRSGCLLLFVNNMWRKEFEHLFLKKN